MRSKISLLLFCLALFTQTLLAQQLINGRITDRQSGEPLAFVHIVPEGTRQGTMSDIDGNFQLMLPKDVICLQLSYVGYATHRYCFESEIDFHYIGMHRQEIQLVEVVVYPGENPADRIIRQAIAHMDKNNPENLSSFTYNSYNKFVATLDRDYYLDRWQRTGDPSQKRISDHLEDRHVFILESVTRRKYRSPARNNETVIANRVSGLQNPLFSMLATELQSFSFYSNYITLLENEFVSPLNKNAFSRYFYHLNDTLFQGNDTIFVIAFKPQENVNFDGLEGRLYINTDGWAVQNVVASPSRQILAGLDFRIQQMYAKPDGVHWFPVQLNTDIDLVSETGGLPPLRMLSRSYIQDIEINPPLLRSDFSAYGVDFDPGANKVSEQFWSRYRPDTLTRREINTYIYLDSVGRARNFDRLLSGFEPLMFGEIPIDIFNMPIRQLYRFNQYERHRIGLGLHTNSRFSRRLVLGGHYAWGSGDRRNKYGYFGEIILDRFSDLRLGLSNQYDVAERGGTHFIDRQFLVNPTFIRNLYMGTMDVTHRSTLYLKLRMWMNFIEAELAGSRGRTYWDDPYRFLHSYVQDGLNQYRFTEASLRLRIAYGESLINTPGRVFHLPSKFPVFHLHITKGFDNIDLGQFDYLKLQARMDLSYRVGLWGQQNWVVESGWTNNSHLPWPLLFTARAGKKDAFLASPFSFGTMHMSEFLASSHISVFFQHSFGNLLFRTPMYEPELMLIHNMGKGILGNKQNHILTDAKPWEKGYFESGFAINKILPRRWVRKVVLGFSPGVEVLYRYGPYGFDNVWENLSVKMSLITTLQ